MLNARHALNVACEESLRNPKLAANIAFRTMRAADDAGDWFTTEAAYALLNAMGVRVFPALPFATVL